MELYGFEVNDWFLFSVALFIVGILVYVASFFLLRNNTSRSAEQKLTRQLIFLACLIVLFISLILALPVSESSRNQVLALFGVLLSGLLAFSSTSIVSNFMAGVVLKVNKPFRTGDYIKCLGFKGRVTEKGLLDTEIQTEARTLLHIANTVLASNPVEVVRSSGVIISGEVSVGYDVHHSAVSEQLKKAAQLAGLNEAFVHIISLGDYSIAYKVSGLLEDTKMLLTTQSNLNLNILDCLHSANIEIMSPKIVASRITDPNYQFIATSVKQDVSEPLNQEDLAFDKAEEAEQIELEKEALTAQINQLKSDMQNFSGEDKKVKEQLVVELEEKLKVIQGKLPQSDELQIKEDIIKFSK